MRIPPPNTALDLIPVVTDTQDTRKRVGVGSLTIPQPGELKGSEGSGGEDGGALLRRTAQPIGTHVY